MNRGRLEASLATPASPSSTTTTGVMAIQNGAVPRILLSISDFVNIFIHGAYAESNERIRTSERISGGATLLSVVMLQMHPK